MCKRTFLFIILSALTLPLSAQVCDPAFAPTGLSSTYTPGLGALLEWDAVAGSQGIQLTVTIAGSSTLTKRIGSFELDHFFIPDAALTPGLYTWRVQASCTGVPPYLTTPVSASDNFIIGTPGLCPATVTDIDGNVYSVVEIDGLCWTASNLKVEHYRNGDVIPSGLSAAAWSATWIDSMGASAVYNNIASNKVIYGLLYNHYAVKDSRGLCPLGWHVGKESEWTPLRNYYGGRDIAGGPLKATGTLGTATGYWQDPNDEATNISGFAALPGGRREFDGHFELKGFNAFFWSSGEFADSGLGWFRELFHNSPYMDRDYDSPLTGYSVRCVKD